MGRTTTTTRRREQELRNARLAREWDEWTMQQALDEPEVPNRSPRTRRIATQTGAVDDADVPEDLLIGADRGRGRPHDPHPSSASSSNEDRVKGESVSFGKDEIAAIPSVAGGTGMLLPHGVLPSHALETEGQIARSDHVEIAAVPVGNGGEGTGEVPGHVPSSGVLGLSPGHVEGGGATLMDVNSEDEACAEAGHEGTAHVEKRQRMTET